MIRCRHEVTESIADKKHEDSRERPFIASRRLSFKDLLDRDGEIWLRIGCGEELRRTVGRAQRELLAGEYVHLISWVSANLGAAIARAAGLPVAPLRVQLAS